MRRLLRFARERRSQFLSGSMGVLRMKLVVAVIACIAGLGVGCMKEPEPIEPGKPIELAAEGAWTSDERVELERACSMWRDFTNGALDCRIVPAGSAEMHIVRTQLGGYYTSIQPAQKALYVDPDAIAKDGFDLHSGLGAIVANAIGRAALVPEHAELGIMGQRDIDVCFSEADRASCRAAGFCR